MSSVPFSMVGSITLNWPGSALSRVVIQRGADGRPNLIIGGPAWQDKFIDQAVPFQVLSFDNKGSISLRNDLVAGSMPTAVHARAAVSADFNGDGRLDFFSGNHGFDAQPFPGERNTLLLSTKDGWVSGELPAFNDFTHGADVGDVDGDGDIDILVGAGRLGSSGNPPYFLANDGKGAFSVLLNRITDLDPNLIIGFKLVDIDGDKDLDLIITGHGDDPTSSGRLYFNNGGGLFGDMKKLPPGLFGATLGPDIQTMDIDGDGDMDVLLSQTRREPFYGGGAVQVLINDGRGNLTDKTADILPGQNSPGSWIEFIYKADLNADGFQDLIFSTSSFTPDIFQAFWLNDGTGRFSPFTAGQLGLTGLQIMPMDIDGDGRPELIDFSRNLGSGPLDIRLYKGTLNNGPAFTDPALRGAAGFNEQFYLNQNPDIATAVRSGALASGLDHYLQFGKAEGRRPFALGTEVWGAASADVITLVPGDDFVTGRAGNDRIDGHRGIDTASYAGKRSNYQVTIDTNGQVTITDLRQGSPDGTDILTSVEVLRFADELVSLSPSVAVVERGVVFSEAFYLTRNPDVAAAVKAGSIGNPLDHYIENGRAEGRGAIASITTIVGTNQNDTLTLTAANDIARMGRGNDTVVAGGGVDAVVFSGKRAEFDVTMGSDGTITVRDLRTGLPDGIDTLAGVEVLVFSDYAVLGARPSLVHTSAGLFDPNFYLTAYPDIAAAVKAGSTTAQQHYEQFGRLEGRAPHALFNPTWYLAQNPDIAAANIDPYQHFQNFGWREGRDPSPWFDVSAYLATYGDIAAAGVNPLEHAILYGIAEGRMLPVTDLWTF